MTSIANTSDDPVELQFPDGCYVLLRAYRTADAVSPVWDQARDVACTQVITKWVLEPETQRTLETSIRDRQILGDSLPPGIYHLSAVVRPSGQPIEVMAGPVLLRR